MERFIDFLKHSAMTREQVREAVFEVERLNIGRHGYGSAAFGANLHEAYERLSERDVTASELEIVMGMARDILQRPLVVLPGVEATLAELGKRHELTLFTKGERVEQQLKVDRSGLAPLFARVVIAPEKDPAAYRELVTEHGLDPGRTWMVGNSPRSDINPALEVGLGAVFVPHSRTWKLELAEIVSSPRLIVVDRFEELCRHF
ncbi:MAG: HAD hydrolase-like protein [Candidatus Dormibacteraeota bacterium]|nr:HAD hydrolase-like protein [Candidatus Dormibacteraeota bacterium]